MVDLVRGVDIPPQQQRSASSQNTFPEEMKGIFQEKNKESALPRARTENRPSAPIQRIENKPSPDAADRAIEDIRKKLASAPAGSVVSSATAQERKAREDAAMNEYYQSVWSVVKDKWAFPDELLQGKNLLTVVRVRIMRNGEIRDLSFEQKSSYAPFDESVMKALQKASPLSPLPSEISGSSIELGIRFYSSQLVGP
jgi:TonB family protein